MKSICHYIILFLTVSGCASGRNMTVFTHANIIDGTGKDIQLNQNIIVKNGVIVSIQNARNAYPKNTEVIDLTDKYIIPQLINSHGHLGMIKDATISELNYTSANIKNQLLRYQKYGVGAVLVLGTDQPAMIAIRDSSRAGQIPGATIYSALYGFGVKNGAPPIDMGMLYVLRPETPEQAIRQVDSLAQLKPDIIKMWVDDFGGQYPKMKPEIFGAIIKAAHAKGIRVAAHVYYLEDAHRLVDFGVDVFAHSIRDKEVDDDLLQKMKKKGVIYIPTLAIDKFAFVYENSPAWMHDPFFKASLEPGVFEMISSASYQERVANNPNTAREKAGWETAMKNLLKIQQAGIPVLVGTDSGAQPIRAQGFSEHFEMELFVTAGLTPLEAISAATGKGATLLRIDALQGTVQKGKKADFIVLYKNPLVDIQHTRSIKSVYKDGKKVSNGPL